MRRFVLTAILSSCIFWAKAQVAEMNWTLDYQIYLKLANDSDFVYDIREAFHVVNSKEITASEYVFYPVNPGVEFASSLSDSLYSNVAHKTLWSALHANIGGGWVHFTNCIAYAMETRKLDLTSPLMLRPKTNWKPKPVTESYKRTQKWEYYVPVEQKHAQKEYKIRLLKGDLGDLKNLPQSYIDLFLNTSQKQYDAYKSSQNYNLLAKIDLVKLLLGSNYLGEAQILYIASAVLESVQAYSSNMLPSVIVFDEFDAAVVLSLDANGYKIEKIVYKAASGIDENEAIQRSSQIEEIIHKINDYNSNSFKKRLGSYYKN
ncbi:MAG: hypothetical protein JXB34_08895 [Bacteroidales bacterium]|nr:hypothetical protein [Bacteroidales bacterium]